MLRMVKPKGADIAAAMSNDKPKGERMTLERNSMTDEDVKRKPIATTFRHSGSLRFNLGNLPTDSPKARLHGWVGTRLHWPENLVTAVRMNAVAEK